MQKANMHWMDWMRFTHTLHTKSVRITRAHSPSQNMSGDSSSAQIHAARNYLSVEWLNGIKEVKMWTLNFYPHFNTFKQSWMGCSLFSWVAGFLWHFLWFFCFALVVLSRQQRRVQLMRIQQREERLKKEKENKKKKKHQNLKSTHKQKSLAHHHPHQQYHHPSVAHPHHQPHSSQTPKVPPSQTEPGYHRKANNKRRFDGDVLSPVRCAQDVLMHHFICISLARQTIRNLSLITFSGVSSDWTLMSSQCCPATNKKSRTL